MIGNAALYAALRVAAVILPRVPIRFAYPVADLAGALAFRLFPVPRRALLANLAVVTGQPSGSTSVRRLGRRAFANDARNWVDMARSAGLGTGDLLRQVRGVEGWEHVGEAMAGGNGMILVPLHLGNYELVGQVLIAHGFHVTIPVERLVPAALFRFLMSIRRRHGISAVPVDQAPREIVRALRAGEIVGIMGDRFAAGKGVAVMLFGRPTHIPRSAVALARRTGAPLHVAFGSRDGDNFVGHISERIAVSRTADAAGDDRENAQRLADVMQGYIARFPDQWLAFGPVWTAGSEGAATMRRSGAAV